MSHSTFFQKASRLTRSYTFWPPSIKILSSDLTISPQKILILYLFIISLQISCSTHKSYILSIFLNHFFQVDILIYYTNQWERFQLASKVLNGVCSYLNRSFRKQAAEASTSFYELRTDNVYEVYNLALYTWKTSFFDEIHKVSFPSL